MLTIDPSPLAAAASALSALPIEPSPMLDTPAQLAETDAPRLRNVDYERRLALGRVRRARTLTFLLEARRSYFMSSDYVGNASAEDAEVAVAHLAFMDPTLALESDHGAIADSVAGGGAIVELMNRSFLRFHERRNAQRNG